MNSSWYNQALYYFNHNKFAGDFCGEFAFINTLLSKEVKKQLLKK